MSPVTLKLIIRVYNISKLIRFLDLLDLNPVVSLNVSCFLVASQL